MKVNLVMVTFENGERIETPWEEIPQEERPEIAKRVTDRFFAALGMKRLEENEIV